MCYPVGILGKENPVTIDILKTGFQFKASGDDLKNRLVELRKRVALANALRKYEGTDTNRYGSRFVYRVAVYNRLGKDNPNRELYPRARNSRYRRAFRVKPEHAQYAGVYIQMARAA
jgi:hypothetical protein